MATDYTKMTVEELIKIKAEIESLIIQKQKEKKSELKKQFMELAEEAGLTIDEILSSGKERKPVKPATVMYEKDGKKWSGRGRKPEWVKELEKEGTLENYRVNKP